MYLSESSSDESIQELPVLSSVDDDLAVTSAHTLSDPLLNPVFEEDDDGLKVKVTCRKCSSKLSCIIAVLARASGQCEFRCAAYTAPAHSALSDELSNTVWTFAELHHALTASTGIPPDPGNIGEAMSLDYPDAKQWRLAMANEFQPVVDKGVYAKAILQPGTRAACHKVERFERAEDSGSRLQPTPWRGL